MIPRENETHPTLHEDEAADLIVILISEADRVAQSISASWGADDFVQLERQTNWLIRIQMLLTAFGRSDLARNYAIASVYPAKGLDKRPSQEKP